MNNPASAKRNVLGLVVLGSILVAVGQARGGRTPRIRLVVGAFVVIVVLSMIAEVAPRLAVTTAALVAVTALISSGPAALAGLANLNA